MGRKKKRGNGEGHIRQRPNGAWEASVMVTNRNGSRVTKYFSGKTRTDVVAKKDAYLREVSEGLNLDQNMTFAIWGAKFIEVHKARIKPVTYHNYLHILKRINQYIGDKPLASILPYDLDCMINSMIQDGYSKSTVNHAKGLAYMVLNAAEVNGLVRKNSARFISRVRMQDGPEKEIFTPEEVALLFRYLEYDKVGLGIRIMLASGLRTQELLCLSPRHISEEGDRIIVEQAISLPGGRVTISTPKTQKSRRVVVLPESVHVFARALRDTDEEYIFISERNNLPINPSTFRDKYKAAIEKIPGVRYLPPHTCRHTYASMLESAHVSDKVIQSLLGQSCIRITHHYIHINDDGMTEAANKLSSLFSPGEN